MLKALHSTSFILDKYSSYKNLHIEGQKEYGASAANGKLPKESFNLDYSSHWKLSRIKKPNFHELCVILVASGFIGGFLLKLAMSIVPCLDIEQCQRR